MTFRRAPYGTNTRGRDFIRGGRSDSDLAVNVSAELSRKELRRFKQSTKSTTDALTTTWAKLPANTKQNSPQYSSWKDHLESQLDQLASADGVTPMGYLLRENDTPTPYGADSY